MRKEFHYYTLFTLARYAGFSKNHSRTIAAASQYTDDSTESDPVHLGNYIFDPVRTAHYKLEAFHWNVQKKIFMAFHFLPPRPIGEGMQNFSFVTRADSILANKLLDEIHRDKSPLRLHRLGVALHTYADTWAHEGFSGREHKENDVDRIAITTKDGSWDNLFMHDWIYDIVLRKLGHMEALHYPDKAYLKWRYRPDA